MMKRDQRPSEVLGTEVLRGRKSVRPKTAGQKRYVDAVRTHTVTFGIGPAGTGKSYLAVALAVQALQAKQLQAQQQAQVMQRLISNPNASATNTASHRRSGSRTRRTSRRMAAVQTSFSATTASRPT